MNLWLFNKLVYLLYNEEFFLKIIHNFKIKKLCHNRKWSFESLRRQDNFIIDPTCSPKLSFPYTSKLFYLKIWKKNKRLKK